MPNTATYIALKRMQIQELEEDGTTKLKDGRPVVRIALPGDRIPEAIHWRNLWREVKTGRVGLEGTALTGPALADSMRRHFSDETPAPTGRRPSARKKAAKKSAKKSGRRRRAPQEEQTEAQKAAEASALYNAGEGDGTAQLGDLPPIDEGASETME